MSTKLESGYKRDMVKAVKEAGGYARRFEDLYGVGILDTVFILPGMPPIFAEAKRFTGLFFTPSDRQWVEASRIENAGGKALIVGVKDKRYHLHYTAKVCYVENCVVQQDDETFCEVLRRWYKEQGK